jgi:anhydro-N-acetylmuramic acid kinase
VPFGGPVAGKLSGGIVIGWEVPKQARVLGLMSGTSCDGLDLALMRFSAGDCWHLEAYEEAPYSAEFRARLLAADRLDTAGLSTLNADLARVFSRRVRAFLEEHSAPDLLVSHGQTVHHDPPTEQGEGSTLQLGDGGMIAALTGLPTLWNLRPGDLALGGQGAPLVPVPDQLLFGGDQVPRWLVNIGGIANVTRLHPDAGARRGEDVGPGNCLIDRFVAHRTGAATAFDEGGQLGCAGQVDLFVLHALLDDVAPMLGRSLARESFDLAWLLTRVPAELSLRDGAATLAELTARLIADTVRTGGPGEPVLLAGGGAKNRAILGALERLLPDREVSTTDALGMPPDAREAACFAALGWLFLQRRPGNDPRLTGATDALVLGSLALPA